MKKTSGFNLQARSAYIFLCLLFVPLCAGLVLRADHADATGEIMGQYTSIPPFLTIDVKPNIVLALDISGSMKACAYRHTAIGNWKSPNVHHDFNPANSYYGYFEGSGTRYSYDIAKGFFIENASGEWDGNFLNWLCMRRIDVARKVMVGGWVRDRNGESIDGNTWYVIKGNHEPYDHTFTKKYADSATKGLTPAEFPDDTEFLISEGQIVPPLAGGAAVTKITDTNKAAPPGIETGVVTINWQAGDDWREVEFQNTYTNPVVVAKSVSYNGNNPVSTRVKDVGDAGIGANGGFRIRLHEWEYLDGDHTTEDIMYIVVEAGHHTVPLDGGGNIEFDAQIVQNVTACGTDNFLTVNYNTAFSSPPLLFTGLSTYNDPDMTITRNKDVTATDFKVVLQESEDHGSTNCVHNPEEIHCIAVSPGAGTIIGTGALIEVGTWWQVDNNGWRKIQYTTVFPEDALVVTDMQTTQEADPAILRFKKAIDDSVMVRVREEKSNDNETNHAKETVGYLAVTGGGAFNIQVGVKTEPAGIIQGLSTKVRFGLAVYNYDHSKNPTAIYNNNTVNGGTLNPCYPDITKNVDDRTNYDICRETHTKAPLENIIKVVETHPLIWGTTPIAETLYEIYGFFSQIDHKVDCTPARSNVQFYDNGTDSNDHCFGADNQYTQATCEAAGGTWQNADSYRISNDFDPYYYDEAGAVAPCAMSFVLHFNDGAPFKDWDDANTNPDIFGGGSTDYDGDGNGGPQEILDDLALYFRHNDIRSDDSSNTHQEIISYYVYAALGEGELNNNSTKKMREAAVNGGFEDRDDDHWPDPAHPANFISYINNNVCTENEWDSDADCNPDTFYNADNGYQLVTELTAALMDILRRTASGTAASVISNSRAGEGAIYQAVFYPNQLDSMGNEVDWIGDVHSLWIDKYGNIREDCGGADGSCGDPCDASCACNASCPNDNILDMTKDYIIECYTDEQGSARAKRFKDTNGNGEYLDPADYDEPADPICDAAAEGSVEEANCTAAQNGDNLDLVETNIPLREIRYIWDAGNWLAAAGHTQKACYSDTTDERHIFTWFTGPDDDPVAFTTTALASAAGLNYFRYFNAADATEADMIINFVRGLDQSGCRSRQIDWDGDGTTETYKLGDIIHSTPTIVSRPAEDYDMIYADPTYQIFRKKYENRRIMIYAGGNDGGLHAFNGGYYDRFGKEFLRGPAGETQYDLGAEMWMFIPYNLLPHLKWLTDTAYGGNNHVYYVDLKPRIFDAKIFDPDDGIHSGGWGTVLVGGMRFGGGEIGVDLDGDGSDDTTMRSAYFVLDITNPECPPVILAEFTHPNLGFTTCYPTAVPMATCDLTDPTKLLNPSMDWYLAFGSGPHPADQTAMHGASDQLAKLYVLKLGDTTTPVYETTPQLTPAGACPTLYTYNRPTGPVAGYPKNINAALTNSFFSDIITVDFDLSFQAEALYLGSIYNTNAATLDGHKGAMHRLTIDDNYSTPSAWSLDTLIDVERPVTAAPAVAYDGTNYWVFFGTGRFITSDDKMTTAQESYYGIKEPVGENGDLDWSTYTTLSNLMDVTGVNVTNKTGKLFDSAGGELLDSAGIATTFGELWKSEIKLHDGWKFDFSMSGERNLGQAALLGDIVAFNSYVPSNDYCTAEGDSYLYAVYYLTGTSYYKSVIGVEESTDYVFKKRHLGRGLATTPNIHTGVSDTIKSFVQTSTGAVIKIEQDNPGVIKSGPASWRELR